MDDRDIDVTRKFELLADLGIVTVPECYAHKTCLSVFYKENSKKNFRYDKRLTDENFSNPSRIIEPGDSFLVRAFTQVVLGPTTSLERMRFADSQKGNVYVGAQGIPLVFEQKRDLLPKGRWYSFFDREEHVFEDANHKHRIPHIHACLSSDFQFGLDFLEYDWHRYYGLLLFFENRK